MLGDYVTLGDKARLLYIHGGYKYLAHSVPDKNGPFKIRMGCHTRTVEEWHKEFYNTEKSNY